MERIQATLEKVQKRAQKMEEEVNVAKELQEKVKQGEGEKAEVMRELHDLRTGVASFENRSATLELEVPFSLSFLFFPFL